MVTCLKRNIFVILAGLMLTLSLIGEDSLVEPANGSKDDSRWKMRQQKNFYWEDGPVVELRQKLTEKDRQIFRLENQLASANLSLSIKEKEIEKLKALEARAKSNLEMVQLRNRALDQEVKLLRKKSGTEFVQKKTSPLEVLEQRAEKKKKRAGSSKIQAFLDSVNKIWSNDDTTTSQKSLEKVTKKIRQPSGSKHLSEVSVVAQPLKKSSPRPVSIVVSGVGENGTKAPAFLSEFYISNQSLEEVLKKAGLLLEDYSGVVGYEELWAKSVHDRSSYTKVASTIRRAIGKASIEKIRTNMKGEGKFTNSTDGTFWIIGCVQLGKVGTVWNQKVNVSSKNFSFTLNSENASWAK